MKFIDKTAGVGQLSLTSFGRRVALSPPVGRLGAYNTAYLVRRSVSASIADAHTSAPLRLCGTRKLGGQARRTQILLYFRLGLYLDHMKKLLEKFKIKRQPRKLDPEKPAQRKQIIEQAVKRTIQEYGEALKRLGAE